MSSVINECTLSRGLCIPKPTQTYTPPPSPSLDVSPPTSAPITTLSLRQGPPNMWPSLSRPRQGTTQVPSPKASRASSSLTLLLGLGPARSLQYHHDPRQDQGYAKMRTRTQAITPLPGVSQTGPEKEEMNSTAVCRTRPARVSPEEPKGKGLGPWQQKLSQEMSWL
ncbi:hypothetical protein CCUS01_06194 [Colletotrichum cuscutae]|uniref:Uncharacterized protein n=1 Tax=Colletotrichum cuscutae TaxID=1209917 RepID=A0AAI9Y1C4_9PEZI|nr:hypothetical protein CCUS01_06194 [Colletotrichum cuscutae]